MQRQAALARLAKNKKLNMGGTHRSQRRRCCTAVPRLSLEVCLHIPPSSTFAGSSTLNSCNAPRASCCTSSSLGSRIVTPTRRRRILSSTVYFKATGRAFTEGSCCPHLIVDQVELVRFQAMLVVNTQRQIPEATDPVSQHHIVREDLAGLPRVRSSCATPCIQSRRGRARNC